MTDSITHQRGPHVAQDWLDSLASGACDEHAFLRAVQELTQRDPDAGWDLLSLLDQYYRRGKINPELFRTLKLHLEGQLLGAPPGGSDDDADDRKSTEGGTTPDNEISVPLPRSAAPFPAARLVDSAARNTPLPATPIASTARVRAVMTPALEESAVKAAQKETAVGDVLRGRYQIKSILGRGGTGAIFEAIDRCRLDLPDTGQRVALKVLHPAVAETPELLTRLRREFQHLQSLTHPNIVRVHEYDRDGDSAFFTMEFLSGLSLSRVLSARHQVALDRSYALTIVRDVGAALEYAHTRGVVHGDLNPGNIFMTDEGELRVLDFGASRAMNRDPWISDIASLEQTPAASPRYASCQVLEGEPAHVRDDLYSFACVVYLLLAGRHPFGEHTALQARTLRLTPARPRGLTGEQWRALRLALSCDRERRPGDIEEWLKPFGLRETARRLPVLPALLKIPSRQRGRMMWPLFAATASAMLAVGWWAAMNVESVTRTGSALSATFKKALAAAETSTAQWGRRDSGAGRAAGDSLSPAPADSSASVTAPPAVVSGARDAAPSAPASEVSSSSAATPPAGTSLRGPNGPALRPRIELAADALNVPPGAPVAHVMVRRTGNLHKNASFAWWTESGTAKPGRDFAPVPYREEHIEAGQSTVNLFVPVLATASLRSAAPLRSPKNFYVVISDPSPDASLGARRFTVVTIE